MPFVCLHNINLIGSPYGKYFNIIPMCRVYISLFRDFYPIFTYFHISLFFEVKLFAFAHAGILKNLYVSSEGKKTCENTSKMR